MGKGSFNPAKSTRAFLEVNIWEELGTGAVLVVFDEEDGWDGHAGGADWSEKGDEGLSTEGSDVDVGCGSCEGIGR